MRVVSHGAVSVEGDGFESTNVEIEHQTESHDRLLACKSEEEIEQYERIHNYIMSTYL